MQLQRWTTINRRYFVEGSRLSRREWEALIIHGHVNGRIIGTEVFVDADQLASNTILRKAEDFSLDLLS